MDMLNSQIHIWDRKEKDDMAYPLVEGFYHELVLLVKFGGVIFLL